MSAAIFNRRRMRFTVDFLPRARLGERRLRSGRRHQASLAICPTWWAIVAGRRDVGMKTDCGSATNSLLAPASCTARVEARGGGARRGKGGIESLDGASTPTGKRDVRGRVVASSLASSSTITSQLHRTVSSTPPDKKNTQSPTATNSKNPVVKKVTGLSPKSIGGRVPRALLHSEDPP